MKRADRKLIAIVWLATIQNLLLLGSLSADIFRWDNGELIPGTEADTLGPRVQLDRRRLDYADSEWRGSAWVRRVRT